MYHTLVIPTLELQQLLELLNSPTHRALKNSFPGLAAAVQAPLPDLRPVLKVALGAHAMQAVLAAQRPSQGLAAETALHEVRTLYVALNAHLAQIDAAPAILEQARCTPAAGAGDLA